MTAKYAFYAEHTLGDRVHLDGDATLEMVVTGVSFRTTLPMYEVTWWDDRTTRSEWVQAWRVKAA